MRFFSIVAIALTLCVAATVSASPRSEARAAYKEGTRQFEIGNYPAALEAFKKAYLLFEEPALLFNMAQCYRLLGQKQDALRTYRMFNRKLPNNPNRDEVEKIITQLQQQIEEERIAAEKPPEPVTPAVASAPPPEPPKPLIKRWWFW